MMTDGGGQRHRVVIVGGGFGGLLAAQGLGKAPCDVTLIDRRNFHLFQPLLYQVATGALSPANIAAPLRSILRRQKNTRVVLGEVVGFDLPAKAVVLNPPGEGPQARFLALRHPNAQAWKAALAERGVVVDVRDDVLRVGLSIYHDATDVAAFCAACAGLG